MSWFGKKEEPTSTETNSEGNHNGGHEGKKGHATPTREEAEQARRQRIKPVLTKKEARRRARAQRFADQEREMAREAARPLNKFMRDYVDSRKIMLTEFAMPIFLVLLVVSFLTANIEVMRYGTAYAMWGVMIGIGIEQRIHWVRFKRLASNRFPGESLKGIWFYGFNRALSPRRIRRPRAVVDRGADI